MQNPRPNSTRLVDRARTLRQNASDAERDLWQALRNRKFHGLKFRRQLPVGPFIADFACEELRLIVEVDGFQHNDAIAYDEDRTKWLQAAGWQVIRFTASEVIKTFDAVLATLALAAKPSN